MDRLAAEFRHSQLLKLKRFGYDQMIIAFIRIERKLLTGIDFDTAIQQVLDDMEQVNG